MAEIVPYENIEDRQPYRGHTEEFTKGNENPGTCIETMYFYTKHDASRNGKVIRGIELLWENNTTGMIGTADGDVTPCHIFPGQDVGTLSTTVGDLVTGIGYRAMDDRRDYGAGSSRSKSYDHQFGKELLRFQVEYAGVPSPQGLDLEQGVDIKWLAPVIRDYTRKTVWPMPRDYMRGDQPWVHT